MLRGPCQDLFLDPALLEAHQDTAELGNGST